MSKLRGVEFTAKNAHRWLHMVVWWYAWEFPEMPPSQEGVGHAWRFWRFSFAIMGFSFVILLRGHNHHLRNERLPLQAPLGTRAAETKHDARRDRAKKNGCDDEKQVVRNYEDEVLTDARNPWFVISSVVVGSCRAQVGPLAMNLFHGQRPYKSMYKYVTL